MPGPVRRVAGPPFGRSTKRSGGNQTFFLFGLNLFVLFSSFEIGGFPRDNPIPRNPPKGHFTYCRGGSLHKEPRHLLVATPVRTLDRVFKVYVRVITIPHTLLISAMGVIDDVARVISMDFKAAGNLIYLVGETRGELGGSEYFALRGVIGNRVPRVDAARAKQLMDSLSGAIARGLVRACHDCSEGGIGVAVALTGRHFVPNRGSVLLISIVTALLKLLSPGGIKIGPVVAILVEGALMEAALWIARTPRRWAFVVGGARAVGWNLPHKFIMMWLVFGKGIVEVYTKMVQDGSQMLGLDVSAAILILAILLLVRLVVGGIGGWCAWELGGAVARRLGRCGPATSEVAH